jgi:enoyl-CoA hydratase/carnithine racemase
MTSADNVPEGGSAVLVDLQGPVLVVTLNRPEVRNAINQSVAVQLAEAMDRLDADPEIRAAVLTGAGNTFSAGMDLKAFARGERPVVPGRGFAGLVEAPPRKPLVAAVEGYALAGGCELALSCDLIVAAKSARFGIPEVKRGLIASGGGLLRLPRRLPYHVAMELALTGEPLPASRAFELGLVSRLAETGGALAAALEVAATIAANGPLATAASKQVIVESADWPVEESFHRQRPIAESVLKSADAAEGATAFTEKRQPVWQGR